jgi:hypothetical protein
VSTHDHLHAAPVGAYGLYEARLGGQMVAGGFSEQQALSNARRVLEAGAGTAPPVVGQQDQGRGIVIYRERLPQLRHRLPEIVACAEALRRRFVRVWVQHLAESSYPYAQECRVAARLARILAVDDAIAWLTWRNRFQSDLRPRCPLTDRWFEGAF